MDQQPVGPVLPHQELRQRIGQHGMAGRDMDGVEPAIGAPQAVAPRPGVQQHRPVARPVGQGQRGRIVGQHHHELDAVGDHPVQFRRCRVGRSRHLDRLEILAHETAGGVVVLDGQPRAGKAQIRRRQVQPRDRRQALFVHAQNGGADHLHLGLGRGRAGQRAGARRNRDDSLEHFISPQGHVGSAETLGQDGFCSRTGREEMARPLVLWTALVRPSHGRPAWGRGPERCFTGCWRSLRQGCCQGC